MGGNKLREIRHQLGLSQPQFGYIMGVTPLTVSRYERGEHKPSRPYMLAANYLYENRHNLAAIIDLEDNELFPGMFEPVKLCPKCKQVMPKRKPWKRKQPRQ